MKTEDMNKKMPIAILLGMVALLSGCATFIDQFAKTFGDQVTVPESDRTPPTVTLKIPGQQDVTSSSTPGTIHIGANDEFFVVAVAEDPEGVKEVSITWISDQSCVSGDGDIAYSQPNGGVTSSTSNATQGQKATTRRWLPLLIQASDRCDNQGFRVNKFSIAVRAVGKNFSGEQRQTQYVTFVYP